MYDTTDVALRVKYSDERPHYSDYADPLFPPDGPAPGIPKFDALTPVACAFLFGIILLMINDSPPN